MTSTAWMTTTKPTFNAEWLALPPKETRQVLEKIALLQQDPTPDGHTKKRLKYIGGRQVCRLRSGDYRIFYTYEHPYISLLSLHRRDDGTYDDDIRPEYLGGLDVEDRPAVPRPATDEPAVPEPAVPEPVEAVPEPVEAPPPPDAPAAARPLPEPITAALLRNLRVPPRFHRALLTVATEEELLTCAGVPEEHLLQLLDALYGRPIEQILEQPDYTATVEELQRYKDGDLLGFLLRLGPEQERFVTFALSAEGPTLVKGGPGTGKSTVALYRVRALLEALRKAGVGSPRILFTTYTKALVAYSEQLLGSLLGEDAGCVDVRNVDKLVMAHAGPAIRGLQIAQPDEARQVLARAVAAATFSGNPLQQRAQRESLARISAQYLLDEFDAVIEARSLGTVEEYLATARPGRGVALGATQRRAVWQVYEGFTALLSGRRLLTWGAVRRRAALATEGDAGHARYDAVVIDEAQDLDPNCIRLLVALCRAPNRLFLTADADQAIYGSHFRWRDVHDALRFAGRTGVLTVNYRTTREIGDAAHAYLGQGGLEEEQVAQEYRTRGPRPQVRAAATQDEEVAALAEFARRALVEVRLGIGACAVLVPTERAGQAIAAALTLSGIQAHHMPGGLLDLKKQCVKVITLKSAKGLEFPVVAIAGFLGDSYPFIPAGASPEERDELLGRERRTLFVGMTRAMRALLIVVPAGNTTPVLHPLDRRWWDGDISTEDLPT